MLFRSARVVVNERTGTVIIGDHVSVSAVALAHGSLELKIPGDAQGGSFGGGAEVEEEPEEVCSIRSEERRVGKERRSRGSPYHSNKKKTQID